MIKSKLRCETWQRSLLLSPDMAENAGNGARSRAGVAQLVEHLICNQAVGGSNPFASSSFTPPREGFEVWL